MNAYKENNIEFRIISADAIAKYKLSQAASFIQISRKELEIDLSPREVLLLTYDRIFELILKIEKMFLNRQELTSTDEIHKLVHDELMETFVLIERICENNTKVFNHDNIDFLKVIHLYAKEDLWYAFKSKMDNMLLTKAFKCIVDILIEYSQHVLLAMHEFNNNMLLKKDPFLCIGKYSLLPKKSGFDSIINRAVFYSEHIENNNYLIKNFTDEDLCHPVSMALWAHGINSMPELLEAVV